MTDANPSSEEMTPTGSVTEQTPLDPPADVTEEMVKNHPLFKKLETEHSAAEREKNRFKGRLEKFQKGEPTEESEQKQDYVTKEELWELKHANDLELYGDEQYQKDISAGIPRDYALSHAKLRFQSNPDKARLERQQAMASGSSASVRNVQDEEITDKDRADMKLWGYSEETIKKHKQLKKSRGQI